MRNAISTSVWSWLFAHMAHGGAQSVIARLLSMLFGSKRSKNSARNGRTRGRLFFLRPHRYSRRLAQPDKKTPLAVGEKLNYFVTQTTMTARCPSLLTAVLTLSCCSRLLPFKPRAPDGDEIELVKDAQISISASTFFIKAADRRMLVLSGMNPDAATAQAIEERSDAWGEYQTDRVPNSSPTSRESLTRRLRH